MTHLSDVEITEALTFNSNRSMHRLKTTKTDASIKFNWHRLGYKRCQVVPCVPVSLNKRHHNLHKDGEGGFLLQTRWRPAIAFCRLKEKSVLLPGGVATAVG